MRKKISERQNILRQPGNVGISLFTSVGKGEPGSGKHCGDCWKAAAQGSPRWRWVACTHPEYHQVLARAVEFQECISNYWVLLLPLTKTCEIILHPCQDTKIVIWPLRSMVGMEARLREVWSAVLSQLGSHHRTLPISVVSALAYASCKARCRACNLDYSQRVQALSPETNTKGLGCPRVFLFSSS